MKYKIIDDIKTKDKRIEIVITFEELIRHLPSDSELIAEKAYKKYGKLSDFLWYLSEWAEAEEVTKLKNI